jgi:Concanavalin A-like lectin/glucanases superfamily/PA14 domain
MKTQILKLAGLLALLSGAATALKADYASTVSSYNPVAYWRLGETVQPPAANVAVNAGSLGSSALGYYLGAAAHPVTGALVGSTDTAASYDASAGTVTFVPYSPAMNPAAPFTAEVWLNPAGENAAGVLTCAVSSGQFANPRSGWLIYQSDTGWNLRMYNQNGTATSLNITGGGAPSAGSWYHLVVVYDGTTASLYVNGALAVSGTPTSYVPGASGGLAIGARADSSFWWNGAADEFALYPSALSAATVAAHYANGTSATPSTPYQNLVLSAAPIAYYRLGESTYTAPTSLPVAVNTGSAGAGADGSYNPGMQAGAPGPRPPAYSGFGASNVGGQFNGAAGHVGTPLQMNDLTEFTMVGWVKRGLLHSGRGGYFGQNDLLEFGDADGGANFELWVNARNANIKGPFPFADNEWGQFVVTGNATSTVVYANGRQVGRLDGPLESYGTSTFFFNIGGGGIFNTAGDYFNGSIDEVAVLPAALTAAQVQALYFSSEVVPSITSQPSIPARTTYAGYTISMSVAATGTVPLSYQWRRDGAAIGTQTAATLRIDSITAALAGLYDVVVSNPYGAVTSAPVNVVVAPADGIVPTVQYAAGRAGFTKARIWFSKPLDPVSAQTAANYQVSGLTVTGAALVAAPGLEGDNIVELTTSPQTPGQTYTVTVSGVKDQMLPASTVAAGSTITFKAWAFAQGVVRFEHFDNLPGASDAAITSALSDPRVVAGTPTTLGNIIGRFDTRTVFPDDSHENYLARMTGFITPTETADYYFFVRSDDASRVYLSTSETPPNPATDTPIAFETGCCGAFMEPGTDDATTPTPISLQAGRKYALLVFLKEGGGGDFLELAWRKSTDATIAADLRPLNGNFFASYVDPNADVTITRQPVNQEAVPTGNAITFANLNLATTDGGFAVTNSTETPPGPWVYDGATGAWTADGGNGPVNSRLYTTSFVVPASQAVTLTFSHKYSFEGDYYDGGQILVSSNGGPFTVVSKDSFTANGYATGRTIQGTGVLNGTYAFNGNSPGYAAGDFITSSAILGTFRAGDRIVVQFLAAWDENTTGTAPNWAIRSMSLSYSAPPSEVTFVSEATASRQGNPTPFTYQWQRNDGAGFLDIPTGSTSPSYRFFATAAADFTATYRVVVGVPGNYVNSATVKLVAPGSVPTLSVRRSGDTATITYTGTLQSAPALTGPYQNVTGASSPYTAPTTGTLFFRTAQ